MWKCTICREECEDNFDSCWSCGTGRDGIPTSEQLPEPGQQTAHSSSPALSSASRQSKSGLSAIMVRYKDAYRIARTVTGFGETVKVLAVVLGVVVAAIGFAAGSDDFKVGGIALGVVIGLPIFILGILVSAQGQILKATLDSAVNSSPLLTKDEIRQILSLD